MFSSFSEIREALYQDKKIRIAVAGAADEEVMKTVKEAADLGFADFILVGNEKKISELQEEFAITRNLIIIDAKDDREASLLAASLAGKNEADILMKGLINSSAFLKGVLDESAGLRSGSLLSHLAVFEVPSYPKLQFYSDGGMNIAPDLKAKEQITANAVKALHQIGITRPMVAFLTANESVSPGMPATVDADTLVKLARDGRFEDCIAEGPIAFDVAVSKEAAHHKGIESEISGETDLFIVPNIESGNMVGKALMYFAGGKMSGVVLGAKKPIVMTSRAENAEGKMNSIALACLIHQGAK